MKIFYSFFLFSFLVIKCFSQAEDTLVLHVDSLGVQGVLLDKDWKFHPGDNPEWAKIDFDDSNWIDLNINQSISKLTSLTKNSINWLRLRFTINTTLKDTLLALLITQYGASDVYIDGQLLQRSGKIGSSKEHSNFNPHNKPFPFQLNSQPVHVIAIRFACDIPASNLILKEVNLTPLSVRLQSLQSAITEMKTNLIQSRTLTGATIVYAVFAIIFLLLFLFYRLQRLNLFFGLFSLSVTIVLLITAHLNDGQYSLNKLFFLKLVRNFFDQAAGINIFLFILLALFNQIRLLYWGLIYTLIIDFVLFNLFKDQYVYIDYCVQFIFTLVCLWLSFYAFRTRKREDWLIGILAFLVGARNIGDALSGITGINFQPSVNIIFTNLAFPSIAVYLALKYARTNTSLERQLIQIKSLSAENIRQEQEKQQLLAKQNDRLEEQVNQRTAEITTQKQTIQNALEELKSTQAQLIQSEKMASLGELTAGIAHEIQNPLNFVNNFSEVSKEMIAEMKEEIDKGNYDEVKLIADDIEDNQEKINHHGKRADAIVKGMLQHSRSSSGVKEPTDINALADEYLRLAYHGLRAKDKSFNATMKTDFDKSIGNVNIIPQDIGRVILNLITNAFYAVDEKKNASTGFPKESAQAPGQPYEPTVSVGTKKAGDKVEIKVADNGNGMPQKVLDKIFQPFFTTKPAGQGTGLGLSLSYDIIKAHGGELKVETTEGGGSEFIIRLPVESKDHHNAGK
jgi:two-component system NtrC family sensor kinase